VSLGCGSGAFQWDICAGSSCVLGCVCGLKNGGGRGGVSAAGGDTHTPTQKAVANASGGSAIAMMRDARRCAGEARQPPHWARKILLYIPKYYLHQTQTAATFVTARASARESDTHTLTHTQKNERVRVLCVCVTGTAWQVVWLCPPTPMTKVPWPPPPFLPPPHRARAEARADRVRVGARPRGPSLRTLWQVLEGV
jgi:hypothetical protein